MLFVALPPFACETRDDVPARAASPGHTSSFPFGLGSAFVPTRSTPTPSNRSQHHTQTLFSICRTSLTPLCTCESLSLHELDTLYRQGRSAAHTLSAPLHLPSRLASPRAVYSRSSADQHNHGGPEPEEKRPSHEQGVENSHQNLDAKDEKSIANKLDQASKQEKREKKAEQEDNSLPTDAARNVSADVLQRWS